MENQVTDKSDEVDVDKPVSDAPAPTPDAFTAVFGLIELIRNEAAFKRRLQGLHRALEAVDEGQVKLVADRAALEKDRAEFAEAQAKLRKREVAAFVAEAALKEREAELRSREAALKAPTSGDDFVPIAGTSIARDQTWRQPSRDPSLPLDVTLTRDASGSEAPVGVRIRKVRSAVQAEV
jgi:hypothetical protein